MTSGALRLFVGIDLDESTRRELARFSQVLSAALPASTRAALRFVAPESLHLTLRFLGAVEPVAVPALERACAAVASATAAFAAGLSGGGTFGAARGARVLWLGVGEGADALSSLAERLEEALSPLGYAREQRAYTPHLTLARARRPTDLRPALEAAPWPSLSTRVERLQLFSSRLHQSGARYERVASWRLSG